jgi:amylosucrase
MIVSNNTNPKPGGEDGTSESLPSPTSEFTVGEINLNVDSNFSDLLSDATTVDFVARLSPTASETEYMGALTLQRVWPRLVERWCAASESSKHTVEKLHDRWKDYSGRLITHWPELFARLHSLYGERFDFHYHVEAMLASAADALTQREEALCELDRSREIRPDWFQSEQVVGGALYVDLFSDNLGNLCKNIDYFKELGITYLHLMPLFEARDGNNDGGYAVSDYRAVDPRLGTIAELKLLASELRREGIFLVLDFIFNHTSDDHDWAKNAQSGNREYEEFYFIFPDRVEPDQYEQHLREIFPTVRRGNFTWHDGMGKWVWTTFNSFQWDLNYRNPSVFRSMMEEMLFISNLGVDVLRLDAVAFIWKEKGTNCENLDKAHTVIQAFNLFVRIAAPGLIFKSEAIVHPDDVVKYIDANECQISYNPTLMALLWESLATQSVRLLKKSIQHRFEIADGTSWVNYLRCHDDIGWTFDNDDAASIGINASDHRNFLNEFYTGQFEGSFARGVPFQENIETGDMRVSGTMASLAGLEQAANENDSELAALAVRRILLLQGVSMSIGGIPLLYLGEEWGVLNDYDFVKDPEKADDSRWIHRPRMDWGVVNELKYEVISGAGAGNPRVMSIKLIQREIYNSMRRLIELRKSLHAFAGQNMELFETDNDHVLGFIRQQSGHRVVVLANFSGMHQEVDANRIRTAGLGRFFQDCVANSTVETSSNVQLDPYQLQWLIRV